VTTPLIYSALSLFQHLAQQTTPGTTTSPGTQIGFLILIVLIVILLIFGGLFGFARRFAVPLQAVFMLVDTAGQFVGGSRVLLAGCALVTLIVISCTVASVLGIAALATCGTVNPAQVCHWVGR